jgi:hypothetical protein
MLGTSRLKSAWLENAYEWYTEWLWDQFGYSRAWHKHFVEMYRCYTLAGIGRAPVAEFALAAVRRNPKNPRFRNGTRDSETQARPRWEAGRALAREVCLERQANPVGWFTDTTALHCRWEYLQPFYGVRWAAGSISSPATTRRARVLNHVLNHAEVGAITGNLERKLSARENARQWREGEIRSEVREIRWKNPRASEPGLERLEGRCSILLSYRRVEDLRYTSRGRNGRVEVFSKCRGRCRLPPGSERSRSTAAHT